MCYHADDITEIEKIVGKKLTSKQRQQLDKYLETLEETTIEEHEHYK